MFKKSFQLLCFVVVGLSVGLVPLDACYQVSTRIWKHEVKSPRHIPSYGIEILDFECNLQDLASAWLTVPFIIQFIAENDYFLFVTCNTSS